MPQQDPYEFERCIFWVVPLSDLKGIRISEKVIMTNSRIDPPAFDGDIVGYSILCNFSPPSGGKGHYLRRVFVRDAGGYLTDGVFSGIRLERDSLI
jgi:hypothetical protein